MDNDLPRCLSFHALASKMPLLGGVERKEPRNAKPTDLNDESLLIHCILKECKLLPQLGRALCELRAGNGISYSCCHLAGHMRGSHEMFVQ